MPHNAMIWFRSDLRTRDNPALASAARAANAHAGGGREGLGGVIGVFVICPEQWKAHDWSGLRVDFLLRTLRQLSDDLRKLNIPLIIETTPRFSGVPSLLSRLAKSHQCQSLHFGREYELNEARRDELVREACTAIGVRTFAVTDQCLIEPGEVRTGEGRFFTVFSPFKRALYRTVQERGGITLHPTPAPQIPLKIASTPVPASVDGLRSHVANALRLWPAGEHVAAERLRQFISTRSLAYKDQRDFPALDATSVLSHHLAVGATSHRLCVHAALEANKGLLDGGEPGPSHWISEIAWREFYRHILVGFPRVCMGRAFKPETERLVWSDNDEHFQAWCEGRTGIPIVDAAMHQLATIGWMHNRLRMVAAMYLTKDLFIDWRKGERFFMQHLIDGDLASNNGGWQWSASTGTDAAPYFRIFNPISQSRRFDPEGTFIRTYLPELAGLDGGEDGPIHDPASLPALLRPKLDYPEPIVDRSASRERVLRAFKELAG